MCSIRKQWITWVLTSVNKPWDSKKNEKEKKKKNAILSVYFGHLKPKINISKFGWYKYNIHLATPPTLDVFPSIGCTIIRSKCQKPKAYWFFSTPHHPHLRYDQMQNSLRDYILWDQCCVRYSITSLRTAQPLKTAIYIIIYILNSEKFFDLLSHTQGGKLVKK